MRAMKRTVSIVLALMLVLGMATMGISVASAAETKTVTFTSNIGANGTIDYVPGTTQQVTVTYCLQTPYGIVNTQGKIYFDNTVLKPANTDVLPNLTGTSNNEVGDHITFTQSNFNAADFSTKKEFVQVVFNVIGSGDTTVNLNVEYLTGNTQTTSTTAATDVDLISDSVMGNYQMTTEAAATVTPEVEELVDISNFMFGYSSYLAGEVSLTHRFYKAPRGGYNAADLQVRFTGPLDDENVTINYANLESSNAVLSEHKYRLYSGMLNDDVTCEILQNGKVIAKSVNSIENYVVEALPNTTNTALANLYKALLNFGAKAQVQFDYNTENPADARIDYTAPTVTANDIVLPAECSASHPDVSDLGLAYYRTRGEYLAATSLKVQYQRRNADKFATASVTVDGGAASFAPANSAGTLQQVEVPSVAAAHLDKVYTFGYNNGTSYKTCVLAAVKASLAADPTNEFYQAVYLYNQAANAYFGE